MQLKRIGARWRASRKPLASLYDRHPDALAASRHPRGVRAVPLDQVAGTARHPSQNTADFLPLPQLRGQNWEARWQRIQEATQELVILPSIELLQVGDEYWVVDGHNRVAAALRNGAAAIDGDVTELLLPGIASEGHQGSTQGSLVGSEELRQAGEGRFSPTLLVRPPEATRDEIARLATDLDALANDGEGEPGEPAGPPDGGGANPSRGEP